MFAERGLGDVCALTVHLEASTDSFINGMGVGLRHDTPSIIVTPNTRRQGHDMACHTPLSIWRRRPDIRRGKDAAFSRFAPCMWGFGDRLGCLGWWYPSPGSVDLRQAGTGPSGSDFARNIKGCPPVAGLRTRLLRRLEEQGARWCRCCHPWKASRPPGGRIPPASWCPARSWAGACTCRRRHR